MSSSGSPDTLSQIDGYTNGGDERDRPSSHGRRHLQEQREMGALDWGVVIGLVVVLAAVWLKFGKSNLRS